MYVRIYIWGTKHFKDNLIRRENVIIFPHLIYNTIRLLTVKVVFSFDEIYMDFSLI